MFTPWKLTRSVGNFQARVNRCFVKLVSCETCKFQFKVRFEFFGRIAIIDVLSVACSNNLTEKLGSNSELTIDKH